ncbi:MAG: hypothetical protein LBP64_04355 [Tannerella sp.]|jgi:tetratricopeptide (TPR) repeat protein|nr:hypothetical protein [Tannerella sp.]
MIPPSVESRNLHLLLQRPGDGINSPFPGKDEKSSCVFEINTRVDSGVFHAPEVFPHERRLPARKIAAAGRLGYHIRHTLNIITDYVNTSPLRIRMIRAIRYILHEKRLHRMIMLLPFALYTACTDDDGAQRLMDEAEAQMTVRPDSAQSLLEEVGLLAPLSDRLHARLCMLSGKAEDEMRKSRPPENLLPVDEWQRAKAYFDRHGTTEEQAQIRLYLGRAQAENLNYDSAADTYIEALALAQKTQNTSLAAYINSYFADIYMLREHYPEALDKYREAAALHARSGNLRSQALALRDCEYVFLEQAQFEQALHVLRQADSIARLAGDSSVMTYLKNDFGVIYSESGEYDLAEEYLLNNMSGDTCPTYLSLSDVYIRKGDFDKARACLEKARSDWTKDALPYQYYLLAKAEGNAEQALAFFEQHQAIIDSITAERNRTHVLEIEKKYDKTQLALAHNRAQERNRRYLLTATLLALICVASLAGYGIIIRRKNMKILEQRALLARMENDFLHMVARLKRLQSLSGGKEPEDADYLKKKSEAEALGKSVFDMKSDVLRSTSTGMKIRRAAQDSGRQNVRPLSTKDFDTLEEQVRVLFPDIYELFLEKLQDAVSTYRNMFLLSFFDLPTKTEGCLLGITDELVRKQRSRLREKFGIQGASLSFSAFFKKIFPSSGNKNEKL